MLSITFYQQRRFGGDDINGIKAWMINKFQFGPPGGTLSFVLANISQMKSYLEQQSLDISESWCDPGSYLCSVNCKLQSVTHFNDPWSFTPHWSIAWVNNGSPDDQELFRYSTDFPGKNDKSWLVGCFHSELLRGLITFLRLFHCKITIGNTFQVQDDSDLN